MRQTFHIFRKDTRRFLSEIVIVAIAAVFFALFRNHEMAQRTPNQELIAAFELLFIIFAALAIVHVIHEDRIPGDTQFWITRPYRWESLLGAKVLFILVFINIPAFLAQAMIANHAGFALQSNMKALLWLQVLLLIVVEFPIACAAALTSNLKQFAMSLIGAVIPVYLYFITRYRETADQFTFTPFTVDWIGRTLAASALTVAAGTIAYLQYRWRLSATSRAIAVCAWIGSAMIALPGTSWELPAQTLLSRNQPGQIADVRLDVGSAHTEVARWPERPNYFVLRIASIKIGGVPAGYEVRGDQVFANVDWPDGETHRSANGRVRGDSVDISIFLTENTFNKERDQTATIRLSTYLTMFGDAQTRSVPLEPTPSQITDNTSCSLADGEAICFAAFRSNSKLVRTTITDNPPRAWEERISYSPFPAELRLDPLLTEGLRLNGPGQQIPVGSNLSVTTKDTIAHFKREATLHLRLADVPIVPYTIGR